ncbi:solute carrier family 15 member 2-like [Bradysia coprophila]|uniref:solute carrier family 15 member 2-like n=1 Tax=Bradysia coprophila TaxID=38358 RepID=UPI00187D7EC5|nr:solute carrier family 15 member 2-like [Bradysia coprophila]
MVLVAVLTAIANQYSETTHAASRNLQDFFACIRHAAVAKIRSKVTRSISIEDHWLKYSEKKYGKTLVWETRVMVNVLVLYVPIILFWALFFQQGSRWIFQAMRMNGDIGLFTVIPEQLSVINPLLVLLLIPVFERVVNPLLANLRIITDLQKTTMGGVLAGVAFLLSAMVEWQLENGKYLHMTWLLPQITIMSMAEILVTIPMMNFSYTVAPKSMKTMLQTCNNLTMGLGNLLVIIVVKLNLFESQACEFILFAVLMFLDMILFAFLAKRYKPSLEESTEEGKSFIK